MVPVNVLTLIAASAPSPSILVLRPEEEQPRRGRERIVPIWVGAPETMNLGFALENVRLDRPTTHDLFLDSITSLDATIDHVLITQVKGMTFFAELVISQHGRLIQVDARPSDAIALAIRQKAPLYINEDVLEQASFPYLYKEPFDGEEALRDFQEFLEDVSPDDFV